MAIFSKQYTVYISHTDAGGIVYHANHLTFLEHCRRDWLNSLGQQRYFFDNNTHFVVYKANLIYKQPLLLDEQIIVSIESIAYKSASLEMVQHIYKNHADYIHKIPATIGSITLAFVQKTQETLKPHPIPIFLKNILHS